MLRVEAGSAPTSLIQVVHTSPLEPEAPVVTYKGLPGQVKNDIREKLHQAQQKRCAYCETRIPLDPNLTKIEHFHPQNRREAPSTACGTRTKLSSAQLPQADVTWQNLLLCCLGSQGGAAASATCDTKKDNADICECFYNPRELGSNREALVTVTPVGRAIASYYPADSASAQRVIDEVLNLNMQLLVDNRGRVWRNYMDQFNKYRKSKRGRIPAAQLRTNFADKARKDARSGSEYASTLLAFATHIESS